MMNLLCFGRFGGRNKARGVRDPALRDAYDRSRGGCQESAGWVKGVHIQVVMPIAALLLLTAFPGRGAARSDAPQIRGPSCHTHKWVPGLQRTTRNHDC
jgi:hypothetical protein